MLRLLTVTCEALFLQSEDNRVPGLLLFVLAAIYENSYGGTSLSFASSAVQLDVKLCSKVQALHTIENKNQISLQ